MINTKARNIFTSAVFLALYAIIGTTLVALTYENTNERIAKNERDALLRSLHEIISPDIHDNDLFVDTIEVVSPNLLGSTKPVTVFRARKDNKPVAAVLSSIAPSGYNGAIKLLVGVYNDGTLAGVRVVSHRETPGLGDGIEPDRSDWILSFQGYALGNPDERGWNVKKDGGKFDQFTGATITPRAVVKAVHNTLLYYKDHKEQLYASNKKSADTTNE